MWNIAEAWHLYSDHGGRPVAISIMVHPRLQISEYLPYFCCLITSGAIQWAVPLTWLSSILEYKRFELPKSASLQVPFLSTKTLAPLISLWTILLRCKYSKPSKIYLVYSYIKRSFRYPYYLIRDWREPPATYSKKMCRLLF